jgi:hypothetical protein
MFVCVQYPLLPILGKFFFNSFQLNGFFVNDYKVPWVFRPRTLILSSPKNNTAGGITSLPGSGATSLAVRVTYNVRFLFAASFTYV